MANRTDCVERLIDTSHASWPCGVRQGHRSWLEGQYRKYYQRIGDSMEANGGPSGTICN